MQSETILVSTVRTSLPAMCTSHRLPPAPAATPGATGPGSGIPRPDLGGCDRLPTHVPAMNTENGADPFASGRHAHESQSTQFVAMAASHDIRRLNAAKRLKDPPKIAGGDTIGQVVHADIHSVPLSSVSTTAFRRRAKPRERTREMGLEAGAAVHGDLASRLHQAIIQVHNGTEPPCTMIRARGEYARGFCFIPPEHLQPPRLQAGNPTLLPGDGDEIGREDPSQRRGAEVDT